MWAKVSYSTSNLCIQAFWIFGCPWPKADVPEPQAKSIKAFPFSSIRCIPEPAIKIGGFLVSENDFVPVDCRAARRF